MTNDGWGSKWPSGHTGKEILERQKQEGNISWPDREIKHTAIYSGPNMFPEINGVNLVDMDKLKQQGFNDPEVTKVITKLVEENFDTSKFKQQGSNLIDNNCHLYFQCEGCDTILDPHTKSFRVLQEHRANAGWIVKWNVNGQGYKVYCKKCGEKI